VRLQDRVVLEGFDVVQAAEGPLRVVTRQFDDIDLQGKLDLHFDSRRGKTLLSGLELIAGDLPQDQLPKE
jgi:hypothetical protein